MTIGSTTIIADMATVADTAHVMERARVEGTGRVEGRAYMSGNSINRNGVLKDSARMEGHARLTGGVVSGNALLAGNVRVYPGSQIYGLARLSDKVTVNTFDHEGDDTRIFGFASLHNDVLVSNGARVHGPVNIMSGHIGILADVFRDSHVYALDGMFTDTVTVYRTVNGGARVQAGCQNFDLMSAPKHMTELATHHAWELPKGWRSLLDGFIDATRWWAGDVCTSSHCCRDNKV